MLEVRVGAEHRGLELIYRSLDSGVLASLSDRDWRTLSGVLSFFKSTNPDIDRCLINYAELGMRLRTGADEARQRLLDLTEARIREEPIVWVVEEDSGPVTVWLNYWWFGSATGAEASDLGPVIHYYRKVLGRSVLSSSEIEAVRRWRDEYGFAREVIVELLEECYQRGVKHLKYFEAVARAWHDDGVKTLGDLQGRRSGDRELLARYSRLLNYLRIGRNPTEPEKRLIRKWTKDWGFSDEVIRRACDESSGSSNPMKLVDRILDAWQERGVRTVADAEKILEEYRSRNNWSQKGNASDKGTAFPSNRRNPGRSASAQQYDDLFLR